MRGAGFSYFVLQATGTEETVLNVVTSPRVHVLPTGYQVSEHESSPPNTPTINPDKHIVEVGSMACCAFEMKLLLEVEITLSTCLHPSSKLSRKVYNWNLDHEQLGKTNGLLALSCQMSVHIGFPRPKPMPKQGQGQLGLLFRCFCLRFNNLLAAASGDASGNAILAIDMEFPGFLRQEPRSGARAQRYQALRWILRFCFKVPSYQYDGRILSICFHKRDASCP